MNGSAEAEGRSSSFLGGAYAQSPTAHFTSIQQGAGSGGFQAKSVLDEAQVMKAPNGMSAADRARQPVQGAGQSLNGQSEDTFTKRMWVGSPYRTFG